MDITIEQLRAMSDEELLKFAVKNMENTPKMEVIYVNTDEIPNFRPVFVYNFESVKKYIQYNKKEAKVYVPHIDQREHKTLKKTVFSKIGKHDRIPWTKYFNVLKVRAKNELFGLVTVEYAFLKVLRNHDPRYPRDERVEKITEECMYYVPGENTFQQVDLEDEESEKTKIFEKINEMKEYVLVRFLEHTYEYLEAFDVVHALDNPGENKKQLIHFYKTWNHFFSHELEKGMKLAFLYNHIAPKEYRAFKKIIKKYKLEIQTKYEMIKKAAADRKGDISKELNRNEFAELTSFLLDFKTPREEGSEKYGFFLLDGEVYPNIGEIERRDYFMDVASKEEEEERKNTLVEHYLTGVVERKELKDIEKPSALRNENQFVILNNIKEKYERSNAFDLYLDSIVTKELTREMLDEYVAALVKERDR
ncbi:hypothetical protein [Bacillus cereus group sp. Bce015]|uniref:hypothetical protein n=1 Tax=Bacillus cereus group sp. Bce015 TaxID=3445249 RepID=UPI003F2084EB